MKIKTRGEEVDITLGARFVEVYAGSRFGPVVFMEATSEPEVDGDMVSWMARNLVTGEKVSYGVHLKYWQYSPVLCLIDSIVFNEKIMPFRPWPMEVVSKGVFMDKKVFKRSNIEENMHQENKMSQVLKRFFTKNTSKVKEAEKLYRLLSKTRFDKLHFRVHELSERISVIEQVINGWWKQRYLLNEDTCRAYEIMDEGMTFTNFTTDDIDWKSLESLPDYMIERARRLSALFPTFVSCFQNGVAKVSWQLNPDGRYYRDDDGYGMTDDEETTVYGFIDTEMNVLVKFQYIGDDWERLKEMRREAERKLRK